MKRILICDDEEEICDFLKETFLSEGFEVASFIAGEKAMEASAKERFDCAIVDLKLQTAVSGLDLVQFLRNRQPNIKIIVITGYIDVGLKYAAESAGISFFAEKPNAVRPDVIIPLVKQALGLR